MIAPRPSARSEPPPSWAGPLDPDQQGWARLTIVVPRDRCEDALQALLDRLADDRPLSCGGRIENWFFLRRENGASTALEFWFGQAEVDRFASLLEFARHNGEPMGMKAGPPTGHGMFPAIKGAPFDGDKGAELLTAFLCDLQPLVTALIRSIGTDKARLRDLASELLLAHLVAVDLKRNYPAIYGPAEHRQGLLLPKAFPLLRAHSEGWAVMTKVPADTLSKMEMFYRQNKDRSHFRARTVLAQFRDGVIGSPEAFAWLALIDKYMKTILRMIARDEIKVSFAKGWIGDNYDLSSSSYHKNIQDSQGLLKLLMREPGYLSLRVCMSLLYLTLNNIGLRTLDRFFLCHSTYRSCEDLFSSPSHNALRTMPLAFMKSSIKWRVTRGAGYLDS